MTTQPHVLFSNTKKEPSKKEQHTSDQPKGKKPDKRTNGATSPDAKKLQKISSSASRVLLDVTGVRPFDFFPDHLVIDEHKITVTIRHFIMSGSTQSFPISDIQDVVVEAIPFFATLKITLANYRNNPLTLGFLPREKAFEARRLVFGLQQAMAQNIDITQISDTKEVKKQLEAIGKVSS